MYLNFVDSVFVLAVSIFYRESFLRRIEALGSVRIFNLNFGYISMSFELFNYLFHTRSSCNLSIIFLFYLIREDPKVLSSLCVIWHFGLCLIKCSGAHCNNIISHCKIMSYSIFFLASNTVVFLFTIAHKIADFVSVCFFYDGIYLKENFLVYKSL